MPNRFVPLNSSSSMPSLVNQINQNFAQLDAEAVVKQFNGGSGETLLIGKTGNDTLGIKATEAGETTMITGKYQSNPSRYGSVYYQDGVPVALMGQAPDDGRMGIWTAKPGQNVLTLLGG